MGRKTILRALVGIPIGIAIGYIITIIVSAIIGDGLYHAAVPELALAVGGEFKAVIIQTLVYCLYGTVFAGASVIWEIEGWSILKQTLVHMVTVSVVFFPLSWLMKWMPHNFSGILVYVLVFLAIYAIIWLSTWLCIRRNLSEINRNLKKS